tara:strand:+ start:497 stop:958 length:462 start_codon:yes stop_codon:yes gene_type:complete
MKYKIHTDVFTEQECKNIIKQADKWYNSIVYNDDYVVNPNGKFMRQFKEAEFKCKFTEWDNLPIHKCIVTRYKEKDFLNEHSDRTWTAHGLKAKDIMIVPLNEDYVGGQFTINGGEVVPQKVGSVIQIGLYTKHGVSKVLEGTRYSMVFWNFA